MKKRISDIDGYFIKIVDTVALRATCNRGMSGCIITKDKYILTTGYVGAPIGFNHCGNRHLLSKVLHEDGSITTHCVGTVHAEINAIIQAAKRGICIDGATLYCTMTPCLSCAMAIINCGIKRVVCKNRYKLADLSESYFEEAGI